MKKRTVVFDFDGVINSYKSGWEGYSVISDPPVDGIKEAIDNIRQKYKVVVVSSRCDRPEGIKAIKEYLKLHDIKVDDVTKHKPPAVVYIDDRALTFDGNPNLLLNKIDNFVPWNKK